MVLRRPDDCKTLPYELTITLTSFELTAAADTAFRFSMISLVQRRIMIVALAFPDLLNRNLHLKRCIASRKGKEYLHDSMTRVGTTQKSSFTCWERRSTSHGQEVSRAHIGITSKPYYHSTSTRYVLWRIANLYRSDSWWHRNSHSYSQKYGWQNQRANRSTSELCSRRDQCERIKLYSSLHRCSLTPSKSS